MSSDLHQHARQLLRARGCGRLQQEVARGLQLVGQRGLLLHQAADQGWRSGASGTVKLQALGAHQARHGQQRIDQRQRAVARVEQRVGRRAPHEM